MNGGALRFLQALLCLVCVSHITIGAGLNVSSDFAPFMAKAYGATVDWTPEFSYILRPLGAFMFCLGLVAAMAARDPLRYRPVIYIFVILFAIRGGQRLVFSGHLSDIFGIEPGRNLTNLAFFTLLACALVVSERIASKQAAANSDAPERVPPVG